MVCATVPFKPFIVVSPKVLVSHYPWRCATVSLKHPDWIGVDSADGVVLRGAELRSH